MDFYVADLQTIAKLKLLCGKILTVEQRPWSPTSHHRPSCLVDNQAVEWPNLWAGQMDLAA